ncbi:MAG: FAD-binding protein [Methylococcaceae bacterium]|nr:FAD-binding protein [Methylococcaceae bacterium]
MKNHYELIIIGGGAAGLSAAVTAAEHGIKTALLDEQAAIGGQIYRGIESVPEERGQQLGSEYLRGRPLAEAFHTSGVDYFPNTQVWALNKQREISLTQDDEAKTLSADQVIVANGAMERPVPFSDWTLTGVMNAGAGQVLFKSSGVVPADDVVLAGSGALLLLLASQYIRAGVKVTALLDMSTLGNQISSIPKFPKALLAAHYLIKGMAYELEIKRAGVPILKGVSELEALGEEKLESIRFKHKGSYKTIDTDLLLTHFGVIPHVWLTQAAGCEHKWDASQQCWRPKHNDWGQSSLDGILIAGDGGGINGARAAEFAGRIAAIHAVYALGQIDKHQRNRLAAKDKKALVRERYIRPFLEAWFAIPPEVLATPDNKTVVCRCEEVTAGEIRETIAKGHEDSNQVKFLTRCGMGVCQGRQCANAVAHIVARETGKPIQQAGLYRGRPPVTPLTLGQLADLFPQEGEE